MVALGFHFIALFAFVFWFTARRDFALSLAALAVLCPAVAVDLPELGWIVAEYGRQPWAIEGVLPTFLAASGIGGAGLFSLIGFVLFYSSLLVIDVMLMRRYVRMGPVEALGGPPPAPIKLAAVAS